MSGDRFRVSVMYPNGRCRGCGNGVDEAGRCYTSDCGRFDPSSPDVNDDDGARRPDRGAVVTTYPTYAADGHTLVWACCLSTIGPVCAHLPADYRPCAACGRPIRKDGGRYVTADGKTH